jgi:ergothioneine biosynthesis protein EgtB
MISKERFHSVRTATLRICEGLQAEDHIPQPAVFVSPPKWHLGHTTWFFENFLCSLFDNYEVFDADFNYCFNSYYESVGKRVDRTERGFQSRPTLERVLEYRSHVDQFLEIVLQDIESWLPEWREILEIGLNHEEQHQELLWYDLKYILGTQSLEPTYPDGPEIPLVNSAGISEWINHEGGLSLIGHSGADFCFDNEMPVHQVHLMPFSLRNALVSCGEWMAFIEAGAYSDPLLWTADGLDWLRKNQIIAPLYWRWEKHDGWTSYGFSGRKKIDSTMAVSHISWYEAQAFCEWAGYRLPTEFEWEALSPQLKHGKLWEHTYSAYLPYPGFRHPEGAIGEYNGKFMINQMVLRGGSYLSPEGHIRPSYRNFFHPEMRWQASGLRPVKRL